MRLIIDITELESWQGKLTGVPRVMQELAQRFIKGLKDDVTLVVWDPIILNYRQVGNEILNRDMQAAKETVKENSKSLHVIKTIARKAGINRKKINSIKKGFNKIYTQDPKMSHNSIDIGVNDFLLVLADWHGSDYNFIKFLYEVESKGTKLVQISYDLLPLVTPQYSGHSSETFKKYVEEIYPITDLIIAISKHTKSDAIYWLNSRKLNVPKIEVMRLGDDFDLSKPKIPTEESEYFLKNSKKFLLCVGTIEARKNHALLYYTYKLADSRKISLPKIVIVGRLGWMSNDTYHLIKNDPVTKDKFIFLHSASDEELSWLYKNCKFTIYPSFYEGWGLPIAESIYNGVPCICSNTSSMPEVVGNLAGYFNPSSADECLNQIEFLLNDKNLQETTKKIKKYRLISWDETYYEVLKYIDEVK